MSTSYSAYSTDPTTTYNPHPHPHPRPSTSTTSPPLDPNKPTSLISSNGFFEAYVVANKKELEVIRQENQEREYDDLGERVIRSGMTTGYCVSEIGQVSDLLGSDGELDSRGCRVLPFGRDTQPLLHHIVVAYRRSFNKYLHHTDLHR